MSGDTLSRGDRGTDRPEKLPCGRVHAPLEMPADISLVAVPGYGAAMLAGFYTVYHIVFLKFREKR